MTFDPITNRVPYGLLEKHERIALAKWPYGWQVYDDRVGWVESSQPSWLIKSIYRGKPAPQEDV